MRDKIMAAWSALVAKRTLTGWLLFFGSGLILLSDKWDSFNSLLNKIVAVTEMGLLASIVEAARSPALQLTLFLAGCLWIGIAVIIGLKKQGAPKSVTLSAIAETARNRRAFFSQSGEERSRPKLVLSEQRVLVNSGNVGFSFVVHNTGSMPAKTASFVFAVQNAKLAIPPLVHTERTSQAIVEGTNRRATYSFPSIDPEPAYIAFHVSYRGEDNRSWDNDPVFLCWPGIQHDTIHTELNYLSDSEVERFADYLKKNEIPEPLLQALNRIASQDENHDTGGPWPVAPPQSLHDAVSHLGVIGAGHVMPLEIEALPISARTENQTQLGNSMGGGPVFRGKCIFSIHNPNLTHGFTGIGCRLISIDPPLRSAAGYRAMTEDYTLRRVKFVIEDIEENKLRGNQTAHVHILTAERKPFAEPKSFKNITINIEGKWPEESANEFTPPQAEHVLTLEVYGDGLQTKQERFRLFFSKEFRDDVFSIAKLPL